MSESRAAKLTEEKPDDTEAPVWEDLAFEDVAQQADDGGLEAQYEVGRRLYFGVGVPRILNAARHFLLMASNRGHAEAQYWYGMSWYEDEDDDDFTPNSGQHDELIVKYFLLAAQQNHIDAMVRLGEIYSHTKLSRPKSKIEPDISIAHQYYHQAAMQGSVDAQAELMYSYVGAEKDSVYNPYAAFYWGYLAVRQDDRPAHLLMSQLYETGQGVPYDKQRSLLLEQIYINTLPARSIMEEKRYVAHLQFGRRVREIHEKNTNTKQGGQEVQNKIPEKMPGEHEYQQGIEYYLGSANTLQNIPQAYHYFSIAANKGNTYAIYMKGLMHLPAGNVLNPSYPFIGGFTFKQNDQEAYRLIELAADCNHLESQFCLGMIYRHGLGDAVEIDHFLAFDYFSLAAYQDYGPAQFALGIAYENGLGVKVDLRQAIRWYYLASHKHMEPAAKKVQSLLGKKYFQEKHPHLYIYLSGKINFVESNFDEQKEENVKQKIIDDYNEFATKFPMEFTEYYLEFQDSWDRVSRILDAKSEIALAQAMTTRQFNMRQEMVSFVSLPLDLISLIINYAIDETATVKETANTSPRDGIPQKRQQQWEKNLTPVDVYDLYHWLTTDSTTHLVIKKMRHELFLMQYPIQFYAIRSLEDDHWWELEDEIIEKKNRYAIQFSKEKYDQESKLPNSKVREYQNKLRELQIEEKGLPVEPKKEALNGLIQQTCCLPADVSLHVMGFLFFSYKYKPLPVQADHSLGITIKHE